MDRRKFLKYAGAGIVTGAAAIGGTAYYLGEKTKPSEVVTSTGTASEIITSTLFSTTPYVPPTIAGLTYTPTRVVNDKVHDIRVDVEISNPSNQRSSVQVALQPVAYARLPSEAFPNEEPKVNTLQPTGLESEVLSTYFTDLKGGREYDLKATIADPNGMIPWSQRTEYVREFENIAALNDVTVIADYYTWYGIPPHGWTDSQGRRDHVYTPLLGEYDSADPIVISKHIDCATGYGIGAFAVSWWGSGYSQTGKFEDAFLKHPMLNQMKFCILYENNGRLKTQNPNDPAEKWIQDLDDPFNRERLISDFGYLTRYFSFPQYLTVDDGKPYVRFDYTLPFRGDIDGVLSELRDKVGQNGGWEPYLANDLACRSFYPKELISGEVSYPPNTLVSPPHIKQIIESTNAFSGSGPPAWYEMNVDETYQMWHDFALGYKKDLVPFAWPGYHEMWSKDKPVGGSAQHFMMLLKAAMKYNTKKVIEIPFNEWYAGIEIEPAEEYGFDYLRTLKDLVSKA